MKFADFHLHTSLKPFNSAVKKQDKVDMWEKKKNLLRILESKSCVDQLMEGKVAVAVLAIAPLEPALGSTGIIPWITSASIMSRKLLNMIHQRKVSSFDLLCQEIEYIQESRQFRGRSYHLPEHRDDFDPERLNLVLSIEGGHSLEHQQHDLQHALRHIKQEKLPVLYLTLVHLARCQLANHAFSMKLIGNQHFKPDGKGLAESGKAIIDQAYDTAAGRRILIDIKHMSLVARMEFYRFRKLQGYENIPLVASHCAAAGISWHNLVGNMAGKPEEQHGLIRVTYQKPEGIGGSRWQTHFNPATINLYDEEIRLIVESGGMIGLMLDVRILGYGKMEEDYFSREEFAWLEEHFGTEGADTGRKEKENVSVSQKMLNGVGGLFSRKPKNDKNLHLKYLINNLFHILQVAGEQAWDHVCIGSDYDGFIKPIDGCRSVAEYPKLYNDLVAELPEMYSAMQQKTPALQFGIEDPEEKIGRLMYGNVVRFLKRHF